MNKIILILLISILNSCAFIYSGSEERKLQTKIQSLITEKAPKFSECANKSKIFDKSESNRVRIVLHLDITSAGSIEKFKIEPSDQPEKFTDCMFSIIELISFPRFDTHELLKMQQPFIFSKK